jgi:eukaryotic-like serine/threonine-protein kinase
VRVLGARADMVRAGSSLDLARQLVRGAAQVPEGIALDDQWRRVASYVATLDTPDARRVAEFLGELTGAPSSEQPSSRLRSARNDPPTMHEQMRQAFGEWIAAECTKRPLLLVLEDLHWGDAPSLEYLSEALRCNAERPLMIVALARPEVHDAFPKLRLLPGIVEIPLAGLTRRAAERIAVAALGESAPTETIRAIVERAAGNAFYLEELVRNAAEGRTRELPETVLAMVESRLARLEPEAREVLRAASVFGARFWIEGVQTLVPGAAEWIESLVAREIVEGSRSTRFPGTFEYAFRHALVRDAAYAMLTVQGREAAHKAAAAWLEQVGETDPLAIVMHHELAGDRLAAAPWLLKAASSAYRAGAIDQLIASCDRGLVEGISGELHTEFLRLRNAGFVSRARWVEAAAGAGEVIRICAPGSLEWLSSASVILTAAQNGDVSGVPDVIAGLSSMRVAPPATRDWSLTACLLIGLLAELGQREMMLRVKELLDATLVGPEVDPSFLGYRHAAEGVLRMLSEDPAGALASTRTALRFFEESGDEGALLMARSYYLAIAVVDAGDYSGAQQMTEVAMAMALERGQRYLHDLAAFSAAIAAALGGDRTAPGRFRARLRDSSNLNFQSWFTGMTLQAELSQSPVDLEALAASEAACFGMLESGMAFPRAAVALRSFLALAAIARGRFSEALSLADEVLASPAIWAISATEVRLARAEALHGLGRFEEAREAISAARSRLLPQADGFTDPSARAAYLAKHWVARTLVLAADWLDGSPSP